MCPDCERLKENPSLTGRHLVDPSEPGRYAVDCRVPEVRHAMA